MLPIVSGERQDHSPCVRISAASCSLFPHLEGRCGIPSQSALVQVMESVGQYLKAERERQNLSLKTLSEITRINKTTLQALEDERVELLPHPSYVRGFLRIYAKELGLDPEKTIEMYERGLRERRWEPQRALKETGTPARGRYFSYAFIGIMLVTAVLLLRAANRQQQAEPESTQELTTAEHGEQAEPAVSPEPEVEQPAEAGPEPYVDAPDEQLPPAPQPAPLAQKAASAPEKGFTVGFVATELTWIKIAIDGREPFEVMLRPGDSYLKEATDSMKVRIGNAGGLAIFYNDTPLGVLGEHGKPLDLEFPEAAKNN